MLKTEDYKIVCFVNPLCSGYNLTFDKSIPYFDSKVNQKVFFNPSQTVGLGTADGTENAITFSFTDKNITRNVPVKQIFFQHREQSHFWT